MTTLFFSAVFIVLLGVYVKVRSDRLKLEAEELLKRQAREQFQGFDFPFGGGIAFD